MLEITIDEDGIIHLKGSFDAAQAREFEEFFDEIGETKVLDLTNLVYIGSAGLGVLLSVQQRLSKIGHHLKLFNPNNHVRDVFRYSGLDQIFEIRDTG